MAIGTCGTFLVRDSEQDMQGRISHIATAKVTDGQIQWLFLDIVREADITKIGQAVIDALDLPNVTIRKLTMDEHLKWLCETVSKSSYKWPLLGHALDRDIEFMFKSASDFFNGDPLKFPGCQRTSWQRIVKVCTQRLLTNCPVTFRMANPTGNWGSATLETFVDKLLGRAQKHNAVADVVDLVEVLKIAQSLDHFRLPKENFLIVKPCNTLKASNESCRPVSNEN